MKRSLLIFFPALLFTACMQQVTDQLPVPTTAMIIDSPAFENNSGIPAQYTCDGRNVSPPFRIFNVPDGTKSLALIVEDSDAPNGTFTHWTVWNIDPTMSKFAEGSVPSGAVQGMTSFQQQGYGGPCPPSGEHRYFFKAYALSDRLDLAPIADVHQLRSAMQGVILGEAELMGRYSRSSTGTGSVDVQTHQGATIEPQE